MSIPIYVSKRKLQGAKTALKPAQRKETVQIANRAVNRIVDREHYDENGPVDFINTGTITDLTTMARGTAEGNFSGDEITLAGWELRGQVRSIAATSSPSYCRMIMFQWRMDDGAEAPALADILYNTSTDPHCSFTKESRKLKVLWDKVVNLDTQSIGQSAKAIFVRRFKGFNKKVTFAPGASTGKNKLYLLTISDLSTNVPSLEFHFRLHYRD